MKITGRTPPTDNENGLTLVELMIAVAIIGIVAAVAVPSYFEGLPRKRLRDAARDLMGQMQIVRLNAVSTNRQWAVQFDTANNRYCVVDGGVNNTINSAACVQAGDDVVSPPVMLISYGGQVQYGFGNATASWNGGGLSQATSVTFTNRGLNAGAATDSVYLTTNLGPPAVNDVYCYSLSISPGGGMKLRFYNGMSSFNQNNWME